MNKIFTGVLRAIMLLILLSAIPQGRVFAAASLQLSPSSVNGIQNTNFTLTLSINTDNNSVSGSDVTLEYPNVGLEFVSAANANFFPNLISSNDSAAGRLVLHGYVSSLADAKTGSGNMATIVFRVKQTADSGRISFVCSGNGNDTSIVTAGGASLPVCGNVNYVSVTFGSTNPTPTPTPTPGGTGGTNITPTPTPVGNYTPICTGLNSDISQITGTPATITYSCNGRDQSGLILAAEFDFGDGTKNTINENVGSPGTITTKHTYTSVGTFRATCKVRDNDNVWSGIPNECTRIISINPKPVTRVVYRTVAAQTNTNAGAPIPTPTIDVASFVYPTDALPNPTGEPTLMIAQEPSKSSVPWFWIIAVLAVIIGAILIRQGRRPPGPPQTPPYIPPSPIPPATPPPQY